MKVEVGAGIAVNVSGINVLKGESAIAAVDVVVGRLGMCEDTKNVPPRAIITVPNAPITAIMIDWVPGLFLRLGFIGFPNKQDL